MLRITSYKQTVVFNQHSTVVEVNIAGKGTKSLQEATQCSKVLCFNPVSIGWPIVNI